MKIVSNYGEVEGKVLRKSKTYGNVKSTAADQNVMDAYNAITALQAPVAENCYVVTTTELINQ